MSLIAKLPLPLQSFGLLVPSNPAGPCLLAAAYFIVRSQREGAPTIVR